MEAFSTTKKRTLFTISFLLLFSLLSSFSLETINCENVKASTHYFEPHQFNENHTPMAPCPPQGPLKGDVGVTYAYVSSATDPNGDQMYYLFDWGDESMSIWTGPFDPGAMVQAYHAWHKQGIYALKVKVKDTGDAESNWSDPLQVRLSGPYITFGTITGGLGLTIEIKNIGEDDAENVEVTVEATSGVIVKSNPNHYQVPLLPAGGSTKKNIRLWGLGLGLFTTLPRVTLTAQAADAKTRGKQVEFRLLGPFVKKVGESWVAEESYNGYTLYAPMMSKETFLINNSGVVVHSWTSSYKPALSVYLLESGDILRTAFPGFNPRFWGGGIGGRVEMFDWNGTQIWSFDYSTDQHCLHHDVKMLPNGNVIMISWEYKSAAEAISMGRNPNTLPQGELWPDSLIEVRPTGPTSGTIVWEWHLWDHLVQDFDPTKENYGAVQEHPELVDVNYGGRILADWNHINTVDYNAEYDQILLSVLSFDEIWIIDHSTTTEEAVGHTGGRYGIGGDLLYRWGNPLTYKSGDVGDRRLFNQHDAEWIKPGLPGAGDILIFNNGLDRPGGEYSSVEEIAPPMAGNGTYSRPPGSAYGPNGSVWNYTAERPTDFYAVNLGGAQRLPNGNTLICNGPQGRFFEVTAKKEVVWAFENQVPDPLDSHVFRIYRYGPQYPGLRFL